MTPTATTAPAVLLNFIELAFLPIGERTLRVRADSRISLTSAAMISTCSSAPAEQLPLKPGHRYVIGLDDEPADTVSDGRAVVFATSADGDRLQAERTRWADAVAHQNPERTADCQDAVNVP